MKINNKGSIIQFIPDTNEEYEWLQENTQAESWQWLGKALGVDHHMAEDLIIAVREIGFTINEKV